MRTHWSSIGFTGLAASLLVGACVFAMEGLPERRATPSFADFDRRANAGERLNVVFFGASLTWGANASDPQLTSYRGVIARRFEAAYPKAHIKYWDAAIGGTGSQLGAFRVDRDVLGRMPDLVFVDFSANDGVKSANPETLASYEAVIRRIIAAGRAPVVIAIFPYKWDVEAGSTDGMKGREAHMAIAKAYNCPVADVISLCQEQVKTGKARLDELWPIDAVHPGDEGYRLFAEAAWAAFQDGVEKQLTCTPPMKMLHAETYMTTVRWHISSLKPLPAGWKVGTPNRTSAWYDALMSRWLDDVVVASNRRDVGRPGGAREPQAVEPLKVRFIGTMVLLFGEKTLKSGKYRVSIDGNLVTRSVAGAKEPVADFDASAKMFGGNTHLTQVIATGLAPRTEHTLEILPVFKADEDQELRIESICVAGEGARVLGRD